MKLKQWKNYRWKDTEFLQELANNKIEQAMKRQGYDAQQITEAIEKATFTIPEGELSEPEYETPEVENNNDFSGGHMNYNEDDDDDAVVGQLTDEDKIMLRVKWGKTYRPEEWVQLEKLYNEMMEEFVYI